MARRTTDPVLTIKSYKSCRGRQGTAYSLTLYIDGKKAAFVSNAADGGASRYDWYGTRDEWKVIRDRLMAWVGTLPSLPCSWNPKGIPTNLDIVIDDLVNDLLTERQVKRWCKKGLVLRDPAAPAGEFETTTDPYTVGAVAYYKHQHPTWEIINARYGQPTG